MSSILNYHLALMCSFEFISHTADVRLKVSGESLPKLFNAALEGMNELLKPGFCNQRARLDVEHEVEISAPDTTVLLIDFLSEALTLSNIHRVIHCDLVIRKMCDHELSGLLRGRKTEDFSNDVKAVTYHEADVCLNEFGNFESVIIFDI